MSLLCGGLFLACGRRGSLLLALHFGPTLALSVGNGLAGLGTQFSTGLFMGNSGGSSGGFFADRRCAAPREDGARLAKPRNLCIDGVQDVVVQVRSFRSIGRITGWTIAGCGKPCSHGPRKAQAKSRAAVHDPRSIYNYDCDIIGVT